MNNTSLTAWNSQAQAPSPIATLSVAMEEFRRNLLPLVGLFSIIALGTLLIGVLMPKRFTSSTTILVEAGNIIGPLMEGRAVPTGVENRANIAREVAFSKKVMHEILRVGGWLGKQPDPVAEDRLIEQITKRTELSNPSPNLIRIEYTDADPERAYRVTRRFGEMVIQESLANKERESRDAFEFIDSQVTAYHKKLSEAESNLEAYRQTNPDARAGMQVDVTTRISELRRLVESSRMDLMDLRSQEAALVSQIRGESEVSAVQTRAGQIRVKMAELAAERDRLLLNYTEQHPDVVRVQHQLADLTEDLRREDQRKESRLAGSVTALDGAAAFNPLYAELRSNLAEVRRKSAAVSARIGSAEALLGGEMARSQRITSSESKLAELTRDYEVNRDLYQDLLKRRENARVSMNLDAEKRGLSFTIQEPAAVPLRHSGLRLLYVCLAGLLLAVVVPSLYLFGRLRFDHRVRLPSDIESKAGIPLLAEIPAINTRNSRRQSMRHMALATSMLMLVIVAYSTTLAIKLASAL